MSAPLKGFLWLLSDEEEYPKEAHEPGLPLEDQPHLRLVRDDEAIERWESAEQPGEGRAIFDRIQDLFGSDGSGRCEEDADVWRRMAVAVILAIAVGIIAALGAGVAFSGL